MDAIKFSEFVTYFRTELNDTATECYELNYIENEIKFKIFDTGGDYISYLNKDVDESDEEEEDVLVNIIDGGGLNNSDISIDSYLQLINIEVLALAKQQGDVSVILNKFTVEHKNKLSTISEHYSKMNIPTFPTVSNKFLMNGYEKIKIELSINALIYDSAYITNDYVLKINDTEVKYKSFEFNRTNELSLHNVKNKDNKFYGNSSSLIIAFDAIFVDNAVLTTLYNDAKTNDSMNKVYSISFTKDGETEPFLNDMIIKNIIFKFAYEQLVSFNCSLQLKATI